MLLTWKKKEGYGEFFKVLLILRQLLSKIQKGVIKENAVQVSHLRFEKLHFQVNEVGKKKPIWFMELAWQTFF